MFLLEIQMGCFHLLRLGPILPIQHLSLDQVE